MPHAGRDRDQVASLELQREDRVRLGVDVKQSGTLDDEAHLVLAVIIHDHEIPLGQPPLAGAAERS